MRRYHGHGLRLARNAIFPNRWNRQSSGSVRTISEPGEGGELVLLRERLRMVSQRLDVVKRIVEEKGTGVAQKSRTIAVVDEAECTGCGLCLRICPTGAVSVNGCASIDGNKCTACLACVEQCPQGAIAVKYQV